MEFGGGDMNKNQKIILTLCLTVVMALLAILPVSAKVVIEEVELGGTFKRKALFSVMIRYIAPVCILLIFISSILNAFGIVGI